MSKVICDICGMSYPSNAKKCPICGSSREYALEDTGEETGEFDFLNEDVKAAPAAGKRSREIFDYNEVNQEPSAGKDLEEDDFDDEEVYEEESGSNVGLVIVLVILIVLLLLTAGFFFLKYLLPNMTEPEPTQTIATTAPVETESVETTEPTIPCTNLMMDGGKMELAKDGKKLLNVHVYPENTTDTVSYVSGNEAVVTVSDSGTVTAVGEGETEITVTCGKQQIVCYVTVDFSIGQETAPAETEALETIPYMEVEETTVATETVAETTAGGTTLKLKDTSTDITIGFNRASVTLEMDCDIDPKDVDWFTMDSLIAIVHDGVVTATGSGITAVYGEYNGQQVKCIVRCIF